MEVVTRGVRLEENLWKKTLGVALYYSSSRPNASMPHEVWIRQKGARIFLRVSGRRRDYPRSRIVGKWVATHHVSPNESAVMLAICIEKA